MLLGGSNSTNSKLSRAGEPAFNLRFTPSAKENRTPIGVRFSFFWRQIEDSHPAAKPQGSVVRRRATAACERVARRNAFEQSESLPISPPKNPRSSERGFFYPSRRLGISSVLRAYLAKRVSHQPVGLYLMLVLAHRLHGGTPCYVPSLTEHSQSNRRAVPSCKHGLTHA